MPLYVISLPIWIFLSSWSRDATLLLPLHNLFSDRLFLKILVRNR